MDVILSNLMVDDNLVVQRATAELAAAFLQPDAIPALCQIVSSYDKPPHRQYAAVLLRKRLLKLRNWQQVPKEHQQAIKEGMLTALVNEQEKSVRNAIAQFVGVLVKHESATQGTWMNDILKFIFEHCSSGDARKSELGSSVFEILTDTSPDQFLPHMVPLCDMFSAALVATEATGNMATPVVFNIMLGMSHLVPFILGNNAAEVTYQKSIPYVLKALLNFAHQKSDDFVRAFEILESMADYTPKLLTSHLKLLVEFSINITENSQLENSVRVCAVQYIGWLVRLKKKAILRNKLLDPITKSVFTLMGHPGDGTEDNYDDGEDSDDDDYFAGNSSEKSSPRTTATQTMDVLALHLPAEKLIPPLLQLIDSALKSNDPNQKRAAYLCIAVIAEGCGETICAKYLQLLLNCIKVGIVDTVPIVRNAALFALGQFSEHLQPEISKFAEEILPIMFQFLQQLCSEIKAGVTVKHVDRMFYALETFCENLEDALVPYLPLLMERLFEALSPENTVHLRELTLSCIASAAKAGKTNMLPYFSNIMEKLQMYLVKSENEDIVALRPQALDTLASLAQHIGKENFIHLTQTTMTIGLDLLQDATEPELRTSLYNLFAALAGILNADMAPVLPKIIEKMLEAVNSSDEIIPEFREDDIVAVYNKNDENEESDDIDIENSDGEDDDDDDYAGFNVENSYLDEKEEAVIALKQIAEFTGPAFVQFIQPCFENIYKLLDHINEDVRTASLDALAQFILSLNQNNDDAGAQHAVSILVPKAAELIKTDEDYHVVMSALDAFGKLMKEMKQKALFNEDIKTTIFTCIHDVLNSKVTCQTYDEQGDDEDKEESEYEEALIEVAGDVLPKFGLALSPEEFAVYFGRVLPLLGAKIEKTKNNKDLDSQRSFAYGVVSECFEGLGRHTGNWFETLLPVYLVGLQDSCDEVRHNCVYGLGELVLHSNEVSFNKFPVILQSLSTAVSQEEHLGTLDNICGALARLIITNSTLIPLDQVLPVFVKNLPLREDFDENLTIFKSFQHLWSQQNEALLLVLEQVIMIGLHVLHKNEYKDDGTRAIILNLLQEIRCRFSERFNQVVNSDPAIANFVQTL